MKQSAYLLAFVFCLLYGLEANAQNEAIQKTIRATNIQDLLRNRPNFVGGNMIYGIPDEPKRLEGNFYLDPKWNETTLMLYRDEKILTDHLARYNIGTNQFEVIAPDKEEMTTLAGLRVQNFILIDSMYKVPRYFINGMDYREDGVPISGFFELLVDGQMPLVRRTIATIKKANYNTALMVGNKNDEVKKRNTYYYVVKDQVMEVPTSKKKLVVIFGDKAEEMESFIKENRINPKDPSDLYTLFSQYNSKFDGFQPLWPDQATQ